MGAAPEYLIPLIASLVVLAAILLLILCIRGKWRDIRRTKRESRVDGRIAVKKKRNEKSLSDGRRYYNQTSSETSSSSSSSSSSRPTSLRSTELRDFEYNSDPVSSSPTPQVLSPPLSPREEGERDEWRRFRVHRNSTQIEIIV